MLGTRPVLFMPHALHAASRLPLPLVLHSLSPAQSRLQSEIEAAHNQLAEGLACSTEAKCGDRGSASAPMGLVGLQRDLASSMLKQGISCRAISFILFTKVCALG